ncbi:MAG TPA: hypothetical protein VNG13_08365, partial [Mycobacteriales bacterium]|nr:hypothetical protein [Mycobacteriales bacterium]
GPAALVDDDLLGRHALKIPRATAYDALARLEATPEAAPVLQAINRSLDRLTEDPFNPRLGTTAFRTDELGGVSATPARIEDWYIFWQRGADKNTIEIVLIHQLPTASG